jgi:hypothetical protein
VTKREAGGGGRGGRGGVEKQSLEKESDRWGVDGLGSGEGDWVT